MIKQNLHTHSTFSDGESSCEEIVLSAIQKGFTSLGFSDHAYAPYDTDCCIKKDDVPVYFAEVLRLKEKYADKLEIFLGLECDSYYYTDKKGMDFTIGSVHYVFDESTGEYFTIDYKPEIFESALSRAAGGDIVELIRLYYNNAAQMAREYKPDILGHLDLITKLNKGSRYFDPKSAWYRKITGETAEQIAKTECIVEVNSGGIKRGAKDVPYPSQEILAMLYELKVPVIISSDSHSAESIDFWFDEMVQILKNTGYKSLKQLTSNGFIDVEI